MTDKIKDIPYIAYDEALARLERINRRSFIVILVLIVLLFLTNGAWLYYESQWTDTEITQDIDNGDGDTTVIGIGDYNNG